MSKKLFTSLILALICTVSAFAQREIIPVDWDNIKKIVKEKPEAVADLVQRLSSQTLDTTLTYESRIIAFYGQSLLTEDKEEADVKEMDKMIREEKYSSALYKAYQILEVNPLNIDALAAGAQVISILNRQGDNSHPKSEGQILYNRLFRIFNTIAMTGYGTEDAPFCVTKVSDEYNFMRDYLDLWKYESQSLVGTNDMFELAETSEYWDEKEIYFDARRPLEITHKRVSGK